ncbi:hypothetical protein [Lewinella sp. 4G2]|uniref:hypothetical protein n=1 Tax=Lewinella sp. 4G2 TaxID=1803372 RepID=UPI0018D3C548|nr:hypothetical protein [Lewinella sp. 4G2]
MKAGLQRFVLLSLTLIFAGSLPLTASSIDNYLGNLIVTPAASTAELAAEHPYVTMPTVELTSGELVFTAPFLSPDPNQLRIIDLRGTDCYPVPDALEVCGAADTTCILLFTKSEDPLQDIELTLLFDEGLEYGGFAEIPEGDDAVFPSSETDLREISVQNPEAPSFLISSVSRDSGAVYVCFGIRAECGSDLEANPPNITYQWEYTSAAGVACEGEYTAPETYGGDVAIPRVQFTAPLPGLVELGLPGNDACQAITVTNTGLNSGATGFIFTADNYGFDEGITITRVVYGGADLEEGTDFTIDAATGRLEANVDLSDDPLMFNETDAITVCYTFEECYPDIDFSPIYTVVSACDGEVCTGPADVNETATVGNTFNLPGFLTVEYDRTAVEADDMEFPQDGLPNVCADAPYVFDVNIGTTNDDEVIGEIRDLIITLRACASTTFALDRILVLDEDGNEQGTIPESAVRLFTADEFTNQGVATANVAGTVRIDLRGNSELTSSTLQDLDGDGNFDDLAAGDMFTLRYFYEITCDAEDSATPPAAGSNQDCQINEVRVDGRRGCGTRATNARDTDTDAPEFNAASTSSFVNGTDDLAGTLEGYNFGFIGRNETNGCNVPLVSTRNLRFQYNLGPNPLTECPNNDGQANGVFSFVGTPQLTDDIVISNINFETGGVVTPIADADTALIYSEEGLTFTIAGPAGSSAEGQDNFFTFDVTLDTNYCSPLQILILAGSISSTCPTGDCACSPTLTGSSSNLQANPDDCDCDCYIDTQVFGRRISRGFTDDTRTTLVPEIDTLDPQGKNVLAGDTIELTTLWRIQDQAAMSTRFDGELAGTDNDWRQIGFETQMEIPGNRNWNAADNYPTVLDHQLTRLQSFTLIRNGMRIDIGNQFSGLINGPLAQTGVLVAGSESTDPRFDNTYGVGEVSNPGFSNGGYTYSRGGENSLDQRDGKRLQLIFRGDPGRIGEANAAQKFMDAIGGEFLPGDEFEAVWTTVLIDNPGQVDMVNGAPNPEIPTTFTGYFFAEQFSNRGANIFAGVFEQGCPQIPTVFNFFDPQISAQPRIEYSEDGCDAEIAIPFVNDAVPAGWYPNEVRPITGIEQIVLDISSPYYFNGGAFVDVIGQDPIPLFADTSTAVDSAVVGGVPAFAPNAGIGQVRFTDAEFADGVRADGYDNFDFGEDDVTTVGGSIPLIAVGGPTTDSVVIRVPLLRVCADEPLPTLTATYSWANKHLPDYEFFPYRQRTTAGDGYWDGKVRDNNGDLVDPDRGFFNGIPRNNTLFYFPFQRLPDNDMDEINPHRSIGNQVMYQIINAPEPQSATLTIAPGGALQDAPMMDEVNTATVINNDPAIPLEGVIAITVGNGAVLNGITRDNGDDLMFTQALVTDTSTVYALVIPAGLAAGEAFVFDLETDLEFCAAAEICAFPIIGCSDDAEQAAAAFVAFMPDCGSTGECYRYIGGQANISTSYDEPMSVPLCTEEEFDIQFFNDGTSPIGNFNPVVYIPEGLDVSNFMGSVTGGAMSALSDPTNDPTTDAVFGTGSVFDQAEINALFGPDGFEPGQVLTITFTAATSCDFTSGVPIVSRPRGDAACAIDYEGDLAFSQNIDVMLPGTEPAVFFQVDADQDPLAVSCSEAGDAITVTAANVGKADIAEAEICVRLPAGISLNLDSLMAIAPTGYEVEAGDITTTDINSSGDQQLCFPAPELPQGGFVCLKIPFVVGDLDCGPYFVGATVITRIEVTCATSGEVCEIPVSTTDNLYFELEVVPAVTAEEATLNAACTDVPGVFDVDFTFDFTAESDDFDDDVTLSLFTDVDGDGELDRDIDRMVSTEQVQAVMLEKDATETFMGTFTGVNQADICPLLLVIEADGCTCSESVLPFPEVLPDFLDDLGDNVVLCPGEPFTFGGLCADLNYAFEPLSAGTVTVDEMTNEVTVSLNPGFGEDAPVPLNITGAFGSCSLEKSIGFSSVPDLDFGPYDYAVCNMGSQVVDLNIPQALQEDITVEIINPVGIENPNSVEPVITDLQQDMSYDVEFSFNDGQCMGTSTLNITVEEAVMAELTDFTGCTTGFNLGEQIQLTPADASGEFQSLGDGEFVTDGTVPGRARYIPGPRDIEAGFVNLRFVGDEQPGPCGPVVARTVATILLVDCGSFFWDGSRD